MAAYLIDGSSLGESTTTSGTPQNKLSVAPTLVSGTKYVIIWSCEIQNDNTGGSNQLRLWDSTAGALIQAVVVTPQDATDYVAAGGVAVFTAPSSAANTFTIQYAQSGSGTAKIRNARILVISLDAGDFSASSTGGSNTTSGTFQDKVTLSVNGAAAGDYLFVGGMGSNTGPQHLECRGLQTDGSTAVNTVTGFWAETAQHAAVWVETLSGANVSAKLQYRSFTGSSAGVRHAHLAAINLASLGDNYAFTGSETDDAGTDTVATDSETLSGSGVDTIGGDVLVIGVATYNGSSTSVSSQIDFREGSNTLLTSFHEDRSGADNDIVAVIGFKSSSANATETWKWRRQSETSGATTTVKYAAIAVLGLAGADTIDGVGAADGTSTATAIGSALASGVGAAAGTSTATATGAATADAAGAAAGTSTATATSAATKDAVGAADGIASATAISASTADAVGAAAGEATATAVGAAHADAAGTAAGSAVAAAVGSADFDAVGSAAGAASATAVGSATADASGTAPGTSAAAGIGEATADAVATAAGSATATAVGEAMVDAVGTAAGTSTAAAAAEDGTGDAVGSAAGTSTATAVGASDFDAVGVAAGSSSAVAFSASFADAVGTAAGISFAEAVGLGGLLGPIRCTVSDRVVTACAVSDSLVTKVTVSATRVTEVSVTDSVVTAVSHSTRVVTAAETCAA